MPNLDTIIQTPLSAASDRQLLYYIMDHMEVIMAEVRTSTEAIAHLKTSLARQISDVTTALNDQIAQLDAANAGKDQQIADLTAQLSAKVAELDGVTSAVENMANELDADDAPAPAPEQPAEPVPADQPVDQPVPADQPVEQPTEMPVPDQQPEPVPAEPVVGDQPTA